MHLESILAYIEKNKKAYEIALLSVSVCESAYFFNMLYGPFHTKGK
jgi:hypothetical protein